VDNLTACELADVQRRWAETGNPNLGYLGAEDPGWFAKSMYAVTGNPGWFGNKPDVAKQEAQKVDAAIKDVFKIPSMLPVPTTPEQAKTEEKAVDDKKKQDVTEDPGWFVKSMAAAAAACVNRGGVWNKDLWSCREKRFYDFVLPASKEDVRKAAPWVAVGVVSVGILVLLLRR